MDDARPRLILGARAPSRAMSTQPVPLFPVSPNGPVRSVEENVQLLGTVAHVVEVKAPYALVHASPQGVARIASELGLEVFHSKRGGEYFAVKVAKSVNLGLVRPAPAPVVVKPTAPVDPSVSKLTIMGNAYIVRETRPKRRNVDVRRWEVRKDGELVAEPYIVTFQDDEGHKAQCSCPDWIYRRHQCKHIKGIQAAFGRQGQKELFAATA
jgi:hypothetical protein